MQPLPLECSAALQSCAAGQMQVAVPVSQQGGLNTLFCPALAGRQTARVRPANATTRHRAGQSGLLSADKPHTLLCPRFACRASQSLVQPACAAEQAARGAPWAGTFLTALHAPPAPPAVQGPVPARAPGNTGPLPGSGRKPGSRPGAAGSGPRPRGARCARCSRSGAMRVGTSVSCYVAHCRTRPERAHP
jgi:hypothetical protein